MRLVVHKADDALYLRLDESAIADSEEANRILDFGLGHGLGSSTSSSR